MRHTPDVVAEAGRDLVDLHYQTSILDCCNGRFTVRSPLDKKPLTIVASDGGGWDHVSVSRRDHCPTWDEMEYVRGLFFRPDEVVMQLSVARADHISLYPYCLHMWRPQSGRIPLPPTWMV